MRKFNYPTRADRISKYNVIMLERTEGQNIIHCEKSLLPYWFNMLKEKAAFVEVEPGDYREAGTILYKVSHGDGMPIFYKGTKSEF